MAVLLGEAVAQGASRPCPYAQRRAWRGEKRKAWRSVGRSPPGQLRSDAREPSMGAGVAAKTSQLCPNGQGSEFAHLARQPAGREQPSEGDRQSCVRSDRRLNRGPAPSPPSAETGSRLPRALLGREKAHLRDSVFPACARLPRHAGPTEPPRRVRHAPPRLAPSPVR